MFLSNLEAQIFVRFEKPFLLDDNRAIRYDGEMPDLFEIHIPESSCRDPSRLDGVGRLGLRNPLFDLISNFPTDF
jgi:hypothetical protein